MVKLRIAFYSLWALINSWCTSMAGVTWDDMRWEEKSCLLGGILMSWSGMMIAYFDKSAPQVELTNPLAPPKVSP